VPKGPSGDRFLDWIGGYFETNWSVNPHWVAKFESFPDHPATRGVRPFDADDEWYYHMRFRPEMQGVTPLLTALPPKETLARRDGPHSGNPHVRAAIARGEKQHVAWVAERPDGGRGFGFTGGHNHWNWGNDQLRKLVLNAIVWVAKGEVPPNGVEDKPVTFTELQENQDFSPPQNLNPDGIIQKFHLKTSANRAASSRRETAKPIFRSKVVSPQTPEHSVAIEVGIADAKQLHLVVTDGGNGYGCDWADWAEPVITGPAGTKKLTELKWKSATSDWGQVRIDKNAGGGEMRVAGKSVPFGIGTHANSVISFDLPAGFTTFRARGGLDNGGTDQGNCGSSSSVEFLVYTEQPPTFVAATGGSGNQGHDPDQAVA
ncbi:MAG: NPCBM/NEW2 domain-containing protein, partial [Verrucomicrobiae bacterium]|nr:NPCBM/NEW2 domain-containing protein [Verrucomicrobiae bacterium]